MPSVKESLQDKFLRYAIENKIYCTLFLVNGIKIEGLIASFDNFCILFIREQRNEDQSLLVYKHAISTLLPVSIFSSRAFQDFQDFLKDDDSVQDE